MDTTDQIFGDFFRNTSRRWIFDEHDRLEERFVRFNVEELKRIAALKVNRYRCVDIEKLAEGRFNKVFVLTMNDGFQVIARFPTTLAGTPGRTTASEVATMDYLRNCLGLPVPRVYGWDSHLDGNLVGAEYILMEKVVGDALCDRWNSLTTKELGEVIQGIVSIESQLFSARLPKYGSLYYTGSIDKDFHDPVIGGRFCVGPMATQAFWQEKRSEMVVDRGPWLRPENYLTSLSAREAFWTDRFGTPLSWHQYTYVPQRAVEPKEHISLLKEYDLVAPHLIPKQGINLSFPALRHPDLDLANIILHPDSTKIAGIIDWQNASILPFFLQAGFPVLCKHDDQLPLQMALPKLPDDFAKMTHIKKKAAWDEMRHKTTILFYSAATLVAFQLHTVALQLPFLKMRKMLIRNAGKRWDGDVISFQECLMKVRSVWDKIAPGVRYPCRPPLYTDDQLELIKEDVIEWKKAVYALAIARKYIGIDEQGGTSPASFEAALIRNPKRRLEALRGVKDPERRAVLWNNWPYKYKNDLSSPPAFPVYL